jgi:hypothetical protein
MLLLHRKCLEKRWETSQDKYAKVTRGEMQVIGVNLSLKTHVCTF